MSKTDKDFNPSLFMGNETDSRKIQKKYADYFTAGQRVLDVGCGVGVFLELLRERGIEGVGIDTLEEALNTCRSKNLNVHKADAEGYLQETQERYDGVFCSHIIEHVLPPMAFKMFAGIYRILKTNGIVILVTPNCRDIEIVTENFWLDITHIRLYPLPLLEKMLEHVGLTPIESGLDQQTARRIPKRRPMQTLRYIINKIRWGEYFGKGNTYVVAQKMEG